MLTFFSYMTTFAVGDDSVFVRAIACNSSLQLNPSTIPAATDAYGCVVRLAQWEEEEESESSSSSSSSSSGSLHLWTEELDLAHLVLDGFTAKNFVGKKLLAVKLRATATNLSTIEVGPATIKGFSLLDAGDILLKPGHEWTMYYAGNGPDIITTARIIAVRGFQDDTVEVVLVVS